MKIWYRVEEGTHDSYKGEVDQTCQLFNEDRQGMKGSWINTNICNLRNKNGDSVYYLVEELRQSVWKQREVLELLF